MNVLISSARMPFALDEIRKFARTGHRVIAADPFRAAPGGHSRYVAERVQVPPPEYLPIDFVQAMKQLILTRQIDLLLPSFEEVFYLAKHYDELAELTQLFFSRFELLEKLHHKVHFVSLCRQLGLRVPDTRLARSRDELAACVREWPRFFARPVWSRGGIHLYTNAGPLAGAVSLESCHPTPERPWIVQQFVDGHDICSFSVAQHGRVVAHVSYIHPLQIEHGGGIVFESIVDDDTLKMTQTLVAATQYHGHISIDFLRDERGLYVLECNPRPTAGIHLMSDRMLVDAVTRPSRGPVEVAPAGTRRMYASALVRDLLLHRERFFEDLAVLRSSATDVMAERGDLWPAIYQALSLGYVLAYRLRHPERSRRGTSLMSAYFDGIEWDGERIP